jgi:hypothetical protein
MQTQRIDWDFQLLKQTAVGANAAITNDRKFVLIPRIALPPKFNFPSTPILISLTSQYTMFGIPAVFVSRALRIFGERSRHLDELLTEPEMLEHDWVKLCWYNPPIASSLRQLLANVIIYLEGLKE